MKINGSYLKLHVPTAKQKNKKKYLWIQKRNWKKKWNENELKYYDAIKSIQRFFLLLYHIFKWLLQITLICKHDMNKLWNALKRNCFIKILPLKMSLITQGDMTLEYANSLLMVSKSGQFAIMYSGNEINTTWIQIFRQDWNGFFLKC